MKQQVRPRVTVRTLALVSDPGLGTWDPDKIPRGSVKEPMSPKRYLRGNGLLKSKNPTRQKTHGGKWAGHRCRAAKVLLCSVKQLKHLTELYLSVANGAKILEALLSHRWNASCFERTSFEWNKLYIYIPLVGYKIQQVHDELKNPSFQERRNALFPRINRCRYTKYIRARKGVGFRRQIFLLP